MLTMYNVNTELGFLSMPRLSDFYEAVQAELTRIKNDVIEPDKGITNEDKIDLLESWTETVQKKFNEAVARRENRRIKNENL